MNQIIKPHAKLSCSEKTYMTTKIGDNTSIPYEHFNKNFFNSTRYIKE